MSGGSLKHPKLTKRNSKPTTSHVNVSTSNLHDIPQPTICHCDLMLATPGKLFSAPRWV